MMITQQQFVNSFYQKKPHGSYEDFFGVSTIFLGGHSIPFFGIYNAGIIVIFSKWFYIRCLLFKKSEETRAISSPDRLDVPH